MTGKEDFQCHPDGSRETQTALLDQEKDEIQTLINGRRATSQTTKGGLGGTPQPPQTWFRKFRKISSNSSILSWRGYVSRLIFSAQQRCIFNGFGEDSEPPVQCVGGRLRAGRTPCHPVYPLCSSATPSSRWERQKSVFCLNEPNKLGLKLYSQGKVLAICQTMAQF